MTLSGPVTPEYLRSWARHTHRSPLYAHLIDVTIGNPELMRVIKRIDNRPPPNVYLAAIHYLLMEGRSPRLARFYQSLVDDPLPVTEVDDAFVEFVLEHEEEIVDLANRRYTQTNECRRCVALLPGIMTSPFDKFHLVEVGTSAGLNLALDRYRYHFAGLEWGPASTVHLTAGVRGAPPRLRPIEIGTRVGIDLNVIDRNDEGDRQWLDALIWPEHEERRVRLRRALELTAGMDLELVEGSVLDELEQVLDTLPALEPVVVMNSFVLIQLDAAQRREVELIVDGARKRRPIYRVSFELIDKDDDWARLEVGDELELSDLGRAHPHGEWVDLDYSAL
ncbi:MAG: DUF2332 domain-containing protein [Acidimicrobiia bacterium]